MARTSEKVTQQSITKLQDAMNASYQLMIKNARRAELIKEDDPEFSADLLVNAKKWHEDYDYLAGKIIRRLSEGMSESNTSLNKWIDSVKINLPQA